MPRLTQTPPQTVGPFFHDALLRLAVSELDPDGAAGEPIRIIGTVLDGDGQPVSDALLEVWQADGNGRYRHPGDPRCDEIPRSFVGFGRVATDRSGGFAFATAKPGRTAGVDGRAQAPHLVVMVFARGLLDRLTTRLYFADEDNDRDQVLAQVPPERRQTLMAAPLDAGGPRTYRFDIVLQGPSETVFFDI